MEPARSVEKNRLGLGQRVFNSLRLTRQMSLWADSAALLRTMAWLDGPQEALLLAGLQAEAVGVWFEAGKSARVRKLKFAKELALCLNDFLYTLL